MLNDKISYEIRKLEPREIVTFEPGEITTLEPGKPVFYSAAPLPAIEAARELVILHQNHLEFRGEHATTRLDVDPLTANRDLSAIRYAIAATIGGEVAEATRKLTVQLTQQFHLDLKRERAAAHDAGVKAERKRRRHFDSQRKLSRRYKRLAGKK
jgi:hypothetical protein